MGEGKPFRPVPTETLLAQAALPNGSSGHIPDGPRPNSDSVLQDEKALLYLG